MAAADNFPAFNAAVAELTLKVHALIIDVSGAQATLGPEVAAALVKLEGAVVAANAAIAAAESAEGAVAEVHGLVDAFNEAMVTVQALTTDVGTLSGQVTSAMTLMTSTNAALQAALEEIDGVAGNMATVKQLTPAGVTAAAGAAVNITPGHTVGTGGLLLLAVYCTTDKPLQMYDVRVKVGTVVVYEAHGILGNLSDTFSNFAVAAGAVVITVTNSGSAAALLTPKLVFTELSIV